MKTEEFEYPQIIKEAVKNMCDILYKKYPGLSSIYYDDGFSREVLFHERMEMGVYLELARFGIRFDADEFLKKGGKNDNQYCMDKAFDHKNWDDK